MSTMTALEFCEFLHMQWSHEGSGVQQIGFNVFQPRSRRSTRCVFLPANMTQNVARPGTGLWNEELTLFAFSVTT